jgi:hypothetical protein
VGMLGRDTLSYLSSGMARPLRKRPRLEWSKVVVVWARRFLPQSDSAQDTATPDTLTSHKIGRRRRIEAARAYPPDRIRLSSFFKRSGGTKLSVSDLTLLAD